MERNTEYPLEKLVDGKVYTLWTNKTRNVWGAWAIAHDHHGVPIGWPHEVILPGQTGIVQVYGKIHDKYKNINDL